MTILKKMFTTELAQVATLFVIGGVISLAASAETSAPSNLKGDPDAGAEIFDTICAECHGPAATAPTLRGVINRPIASVASYDGYSDGLKAKQSEKWTEANLNTFLNSPNNFAPGTLMSRSIPDAQERANIIAYLASLPPPHE